MGQDHQVMFGQLEAAGAAVTEAEAHLKAAQQHRNTLICEAVEAGIPKRQVAMRAGVSRNAVYLILSDEGHRQ